MVIIEQIGLMTVTGLIIFFIAGAWALKENGDFIITSSGDYVDWLVGVIMAIVLIFAIIWAVFVTFCDTPNIYGYEKIVVEEEAVDGTDST